MSFQAKVKETAELFVATNEVDKDRAWGKDARKLEKGKSYVGYLFPLCPCIPLRREAFGKPTFCRFGNDALEVLSVPCEISCPVSPLRYKKQRLTLRSITSPPAGHPSTGGPLRPAQTHSR